MGKLQFDRSLFDPFWSEYHTKVTTTDNHQYSRDSKSVLPTISFKYSFDSWNSQKMSIFAKFLFIFPILNQMFKVGNTESLSTLFAKVQLVVWVKILWKYKKQNINFHSLGFQNTSSGFCMRLEFFHHSLRCPFIVHQNDAKYS